MGLTWPICAAATNMRASGKVCPAQIWYSRTPWSLSLSEFSREKDFWVTGYALFSAGYTANTACMWQLILADWCPIRDTVRISGLTLAVHKKAFRMHKSAWHAPSVSTRFVHWSRVSGPSNPSLPNWAAFLSCSGQKDRNGHRDEERGSHKRSQRDEDEILRKRSRDRRWHRRYMQFLT